MINDAISAQFKWLAGVHTGMRNEAASRKLDKEQKAKNSGEGVDWLSVLYWARP